MKWLPTVAVVVAGFVFDGVGHPWLGVACALLGAVLLLFTLDRFADRCDCG